MKISRRHTIAAGVVTSLAAGAIALPLAIADNTPDLPPCPTYLLVEIPGTSETNLDHNPTASAGLLKHLTEQLTATRSDQELQVWSTPYPAVAVDAANATTYATSKDAAVTRATNEIRERAQRCPATSFGLSGFSQGADAAGDLAAQIGHGNGPVPADKMFGVALLSDPKQTPGEGKLLAGAGGGTGFAGTRPEGFGALNDKTGSVCSDGDLYCNTKSDQFTLQLIGTLASKIDPHDPIKSAAGILGELVSVDIMPLTRITDQIKNSMNGPAGPAGIASLLPQAPQLAQQLGEALDQIGQQLDGKETFAGIGPVAATTRALIDALSQGNLLPVPGLIAQLVPQAITFGNNLATAVSTIMTKLPVADYVSIGGTAAAIQAAVGMQNYPALPPLIGRIVGQLDSATRKTMRAVPEKDFPMIHRIANELTADQALKDLLSFAMFIASGEHSNYDKTPIDASGSTGINVLSDFLATHMSPGTGGAGSA